ncbi:MAG: DUF3868 domain-containing protein [Parabacteroides sp.]|nr:DUF3868 domain-containing protein [Parabacteroides sp.]
MKTSLYILFFFLSLQVFQSQAQTSVYRGMVKIKENKVKIENNQLSLDLNITLSGLSVGRHQSLLLTPVLQNGGNSLRLKPIVINGLNKQKMYKREKAFNGKATVDDIAYVVLKSDPALL